MSSAPSAYPSSSQPPAGLRVPLTTHTATPPQPDLLGPAPFRDLGGEPVYVASALIGKSVHPCKVCYFPGAGLGVRVPYGGQELVHEGRFDVLPITNEMEWVTTSGGQIPKGRRPVEGGFEEGGEHLFHALCLHEGELHVPGKTGEHLGAANYSFGGAEIVVEGTYDILCWR